MSAVESLDRTRLARLFATTVLHFVSMGIYMSALPLFVSFELDGSRALVGVAAGAFFPAAVLMRPLIGSGLDSWGRRPFLLVATAVMTVVSLLFFIAHAIWIVVVLRILQGFAGAAYYTGAATVATDIGPQERRAEVIALFSLFLYAGFAAGPALGEWLVRGGDFGPAWGTAAILSALALFLAMGLPETLEDNGGEPIKMRFRLERKALAPGMLLLCAASGYSAITAFSPLYARSIGMGNSGGLYATFALTILAFRILTRKAADRRGRLPVALPGLVMTTVGLVLIAGWREPAPAYVGVAAYGIGFALLFPALMAFTADRAPGERRGSALATFTMFFDLGAGIGSYLVGAIAEAHGFGAGFGLPALLCALATIALAARLSGGTVSLERST